MCRIISRYQAPFDKGGTVSKPIRSSGQYP
jgi:hypothetical protein